MHPKNSTPDPHRAPSDARDFARWTRARLEELAAAVAAALTETRAAQRILTRLTDDPPDRRPSPGGPDDA